MNKHDIVKFVKGYVYPMGEPYRFRGKKLRFKVGARPIKRKYLTSTNDVVRNDVLQILFFEENFGSNDILWDIGSHNGHYSVFAASVVKGTGQVFSFEPDNDARAVQLKNIQLNKFSQKITIYDIAVSSINGKVSFHSRAGDSTSHLIKDHNYAQANGVVSVTSKTVNALTSELPVPTFVKLDTEGAEIDILSQADVLLQNRSTKFICELHPFAWKDMNVGFEDLVGILKKFDRKITLLDPKKSPESLPYYGTVLF